MLSPSCRFAITRGMNVFHLFTEHVRSAVNGAGQGRGLPDTARPARASWSSRRARRAMATWRPTPRWCWPRTPARSRASSPRRSRPSCAKLPRSTKVEVAGPGFINLALEPAVWREALRRRDPRRRRLRPKRDRRGAEGQRRIRLGQSDRADACRPLPRRGVRRCARQPARVRGLRGHARVLHQRCRRAGRRARALGVPALPRGARRGHRRDPRGALSRATISSRSARRSPPSTATSSKPSRRAEWLPLVRDQGHRHDDGDDPRGSRRAQRQA